MAFHKASQLDSTWIDSLVPLGDAYRHMGMPQEALAQYEKAMASQGTSANWAKTLRKAFETEGWKGYWEQSLHRDLERAKHEYVSPYRLASYYALSGDRENTFRYLDKAYANHDLALTNIKTDRDLELLHGDPRYAALLRRMGLPQ